MSHPLLVRDCLARASASWIVGDFKRAPSRARQIVQQEGEYVELHRADSQLDDVEVIANGAACHVRVSGVRLWCAWQLS